MPLRSSDDVVNTMLANIRGTGLNISTQPGEEVHSVLLTPMASEFSRSYVLLEYERNLQSLDGIEAMLNNTSFLDSLALAMGMSSEGTAYTREDAVAMVSKDLDNLASSWGKSRRGATTATGFVRFLKPDGRRVSIPDSTAVRTSTADYTEFRTVGTLTDAVPSQDTYTGLYYVEVPVVAQSTSGAKTNVSPGTITVLVGTIAGVTGCNNIDATEGGADAETNTSLISRLRDVWVGRNLNTLKGYESFVEGIGTVISAKVVGPGDDLMLRAPTGAVDIWVIDSADMTSANELIAFSTNVNTYVLSKQPVLSVSTTTVGGGDVVTFAQDSGELARSVRGNDSISVSPSTNYSSYVTYTYDRNIAELQKVMDSEDNKVLGCDLLIRKGYNVTCDVSLKVVEVVGYNLATVQSVVATDLTAFFNGGTASTGIVYSPRDIGTPIDVSDIISVITDAVIEGSVCVDRVVLGSFVVSTSCDAPSYVDAEYTSSSDQVLIEANQYARLGTVTFVG